MQPRAKTLRGALARTADLTGSALIGSEASVALSEIASGSGLGRRLGELAGRSVLILADSQLVAGLTLIELDGVARRITICPPDLKIEYLPAAIFDAAIDAIVSDRAPAQFGEVNLPVIACGLPHEAAEDVDGFDGVTEWVLLTSGTTGAPKMVVHSLDGLSGAIRTAPAREPPIVWGTFYDIRRYGGLQIFLRAILGGASLILSCPGEPVADHLRRLGAHGATHITGTPSHWRRALMSASPGEISPEYVRLSGEIADQAILDSLRLAYPNARIAHAYASTEAGVGFEVGDGREGFPADLIGTNGADVEMKVEDGSLRIRSRRAARRYLGAAAAPLVDANGFVDTGDMVELRADRYHFIGRRGGIINIGGLKVHPEEVEAAINRHESVKMSLVRARKSPITGAIAIADVVLNDRAAAACAAGGGDALKNEILRLCHDTLPAHKVPALIRFVATIEVTPSGKLARPHA